ncbi:MAG: phage tail tape measure protein, partial [Treponema sp.]|nr:phage tail tape measure protein [Treponema sp.]
MRSALDEMGQNQSMNRLAADMAMMTSMTEPARRALSDAMDQPSRIAGTMDASMRNIQSLTGQTTESLRGLEKELLAVGGASVAGPNAIADAYYNIASGVGNVEVRMDTLKAAVALAESGQASLGSATSGLISVVNAYGTSAENITGMSDVFFQTVRKGVGSLDGFVSAMSSVAGLSASVGVGFDELGAAMAFVTAKGQTESVAATQLKAAMISFMKPTSEMSDALASMGISSGSAMIQEYGLADSLDMLKKALGGNQDAMAKALGSTEALQAAIALTAEDYTAFAKSYGEGLDGATAAGLEAQVLSYEAKVARLQSASDALQIGIGEDINAIKGFFVDAKYGFLQYFASPIMSSPVGGAVSKIAAVTGMAAKTMLDMGSGALSAAAQMTTLAANISNAGGIAKMFQSTVGLLGSGFKILSSPLQAIGGGILGMGKSIIAALPSIGGYIASMWASAAATIAATWPILAIIAGVAALAAGVYLLIKNWDAVAGFFKGLWDKICGFFSAAWEWIKGIIFGASDWILAAVAVFMPIIGIPALVIK